MAPMSAKKKMETAKTELGPLLARCRAEKRLRLVDVAKKLGLGVATLSRFERSTNTRGAQRTVLLRIEAFLRERGYLPKRAKAA